MALVAGANKGIGKEIARQLAEAGFTVYVSSRDAGRGERAVAETGGDARLLVVDVTDGANIPMRRARAGSLDILVNDAGISGDPGEAVTSTSRTCCRCCTARSCRGPTASWYRPA